MAHRDRKVLRVNLAKLVQPASKVHKANPEKWDQRVLLEFKANRVFRAFKASKEFKEKLVLKASKVR
jgi:hypothetical protein